MYISVIKSEEWNHEYKFPADNYSTSAIRCWKILKMTLKSAWEVLEFDLEKYVRTLKMPPRYYLLSVILSVKDSES